MPEMYKNKARRKQEKVVSKVEENLDDSCKEIVIGNSYYFDLKSNKQNAPTIKNVKLDPSGYTGCYQFDSETSICLEPDKGIFDLFFTENLKGVCYLK
jgi:hypothetical protein